MCNGSVMSTPADRLKDARTKRGYSSAQAAAEAFGWNVVTYRSHESGMRNIPIHAARKYALAFGTTAASILGMEPAPTGPVFETRGVPVVAVVNAGVFREIQEVDHPPVPVPAVAISAIPPSAQYALLVDGPSVNKVIPHGDYAVCAPYELMPGGAKDGQLVHVVRERAGLFEHTIKQYKSGPNGPQLLPVSTDPRHQQPVDLSAREDETLVYIKGVVIASFRPL